MSQGKSATPLGQVRGLGAARSGAGHWLDERVTSIALVLLSIWFVASMVWLPSLDQKTLVEWLHGASGAVPMALFVIVSFVHAVEGTKSWIDDYVHDEGNRVAAHIVLTFAAIGAAALALFALAKIAFGAHA